uniref:Uncharacterized protein n=1 Tax=Nelumbo nucifera TaxID=4432 RepID=A0A822YIG0_NELNU|nr:TPA_asm: hypothetical protein HUJ06_010754 [Nelumbo nucifera]
MGRPSSFARFLILVIFIAFISAMQLGLVNADSMVRKMLERRSIPTSPPSPNPNRPGPPDRLLN